MPKGPSKAAEAFIAFLIPPACREEVLGDLHERYRSPTHYAFETLATLPLVIYSRARRTSDPQILLMQAFAMYLSFLGTAYVLDRGLLTQEWALLRLAFPATVAVFSLILADAYAKRPSITQVCFGIGMAILSQVAFSPVALPRWVLIYGAVTSLISSSAVRLLFPPASDQLLGVSAPAHWLERSGAALSVSPTVILALKVIALLLVVVITYQISKRG